MVTAVLLGECSSWAMEGMVGEPGVWPAVELIRWGPCHQGTFLLSHLSRPSGLLVKDPQPVLPTQADHSGCPFGNQKDRAP